MIIERLLAGAAAAALLAGSASAQTAGSSSMTPSATGSGAMQSPSTAARPYAAPPTTGGPATPSAAPGMGTSGMGTSGSGMSGMGSSSMGAPAAFRPITPVPGADIIATLKASGEFTTLLKGLDATNLTSLISTHPNLTLFAPTDAAFAALPPGQLDMLLKSPTQLQAILAYHLIATTIKESDVKGHAAGQVDTAAKKKVSIDGSGPSIKVNDATVLQPGVTASNGIIYPIDKVLTPPAA
jgi:hypothetical protein